MTPPDPKAYEKPHCYLRKSEEKLTLFGVIPLPNGRKVTGISYPNGTDSNTFFVVIVIGNDSNTNTHHHAFSCDIPYGKSKVVVNIAGTGVLYHVTSIVEDENITISGDAGAQICELCPYLYLGRIRGTDINAPRVMVYLDGNHTYLRNSINENSIDARVTIDKELNAAPGWCFPDNINIFEYPYSALLLGESDYQVQVTVSGNPKPAGTNKQKHRVTGLLPWQKGFKPATLRDISKWSYK